MLRRNEGSCEGTGGRRRRAKKEGSDEGKYSGRVRTAKANGAIGKDTERGMNKAEKEDRKNL